MKLESFFDNFQLLTDAPNAVANLRKIILQLAVKGKLVCQNPSDESSQKLLQRVKTHKQQLVLNKIIVRDTELPSINQNEILFELPQGWQWERLGNLARFIDYRGKTPPKTESGIRLITAKNVRMGFLQDEPKEYISKDTYLEWMTRGFPKYGDILFTTEAPLGNVAQLLTEEKVALAQRIIDLQPFSDLFGRYLLTAFMSPFLQNILNEKATGMTAQGIKSAKLKVILMPVPPLAEQKRIVEKCDRLLSICDEIEKRQQQRQESILRMNESAIAQLLSSQNPEEFRQHWQRICNNFDLLYSVPETIPKLRQVILQLAVQGKLVRQDPNDEPARELLNKIKSDQSKSFPPISSEEIPFDLPNGWIFARLGNLIEPSRDITYGIIKLGLEPTENGVKTLRCSDILYRRINNSNIRSVARDLSEQYSRTIIQGGELLMNIRGTLGGCAIATEEYKGCNIAREVAMIPISRHISSLYILDVISSPFIQIKTMQNLRGIAYKGLNLNLLRMFVIPLPPLTEQKRIVEKCDRLMSLCDTLEAKLKQGRDSSEKLMEVAAEHVLTA
ncbi:restriction endonuclease subunit S [Nostoc sp. DSM 114160]|jgi:type I restriction enzyme S subunit